MTQNPSQNPDPIFKVPNANDSTINNKTILNQSLFQNAIEFQAIHDSESKRRLEDGESKKKKLRSGNDGLHPGGSGAGRRMSSGELRSSECNFGGSGGEPAGVKLRLPNFGHRSLGFSHLRTLDLSAQVNSTAVLLTLVEALSDDSHVRETLFCRLAGGS